MVSLTMLLPCAALVLAGCGDRRLSLPHRPAVAWSPASSPHLPVRIAPDVVVRRAQFGILESGAGGDDRFVPAQELPAEDGQVFGWVLEVDTSRPSLHWQEHLRLPRAPADWGEAANDPDVLISSDGKTVVAQGEDLVEDRELSRFYWSLAAGDPAGDYELDLAVEGKPVAHFTFSVPRAVHEKAMLVSQPPPASGRGGLATAAPVAAGWSGARGWK